MANGEEEEQEGKETNIWTKKIFVPRRRKRTKKEKEENIWKKKMFGPQRRKRTEKEKEENIWSSEEEKYGDGKGAKYLEKENIYRRKTFGPRRRLRMEKEKEEINRKRKIDGDVDGPTNWVDLVQSAFLNVRQ